MGRSAKVLTVWISIDNFGDQVQTKGVWTEEEVWTNLTLGKDEMAKGIGFQGNKIEVWYEWDEGLSKDEVVRKALNWARDVVGKMFDEAKRLEVGE